MQHSTVTNVVDSILRIISIEEDSTIIIKKLKTIKSYIIELVVVGR